MKANDNNENKMYKAAEVKLSYISKVKASERVQIRSAEDAASLFFETWDWATIEHSEMTDEEKLVLNLLKDKLPVDLNELKGLRKNNLAKVDKNDEGLFFSLV